MNQQQKKYTMERIDGIVVTRLNELQSTCTIDAVKLGNKEKVKLIRSGKVKLRPDREINSIMPPYGCIVIDHLYDFSKYQREREYDQSRYDKGSRTLRQKAREIKDQIMLGGADEALGLIDELMKVKL